MAKKKIVIERENYSALLNMYRQGGLREEKWQLMLTDPAFAAYIETRPEKEDMSLLAISAPEDLLAKQLLAEASPYATIMKD